MAKPELFRGKWRIRWTDVLGQRKSETYSSKNEAEVAILGHTFETQKAKLNPITGIVPKIKFIELARYWLQEHAVFKRSIKHDESILSAHLIPYFNEVEISHIDDSFTKQYRTSRKHLKAKTIFNHLTLLIAMLNLAFEKGWLVRVPKIKKPKVVLVQEDFRYLKSQNEVIRFLSFASQEGEAVYSLYATAIYTGLRAGEIAGLNWSTIDFKKRIITVERSYEGLTKSGSIRKVPILDQLLPLLVSWSEKRQSEIVFPSLSGNRLQPSSRIFQEVLQRVLKKAGFSKLILNGKEENYITFHSLRHTFASLWMEAGGDKFKLQRILGHSSSIMTDRYSHLSPEAYSKDYGIFCNKASVTLIQK